MNRAERRDEIKRIVDKARQDNKRCCIKEIAKLEGRQLSWLADEIGVYSSDISRWISEDRIPGKAHYDKVKLLAKLLDTSIDSLFPFSKKTQLYNIK